MRKHNLLSLRECTIALATVAVLAACGRGAADSTGDSSTGAQKEARLVAESPASVQMADAGANAGSVAGARTDAPASTPAPAPPPQAPPSDALLASTPLPPASDPTGAMLIRTGEASIEVKQVDDAVSRIRQTAGQFGGFVANTAIRTGKDEQPTATLELRVPTAQFDALLAALRSIGKVETVTANAQDVGEEYVDLGARVANSRRVEARLVEMLATRTGKLSDVLTVEQELARVRQEIERHDARMRFLERRASLSSLTVTLHQQFTFIERPSPIAEAFALAWERLLNVIAWCIASLGLLVPLAVVIGGGVWVFKRLRQSSRCAPITE
ncbi:MAG: DUF4349 domain-containing protein [Gemmatimonadota bacterium]